MSGEVDPVSQAVLAYRLGYHPLPLHDRTKRPGQAQWSQQQRSMYADEEAVREAFTGYAETGMSNVGVALGDPSGGLIDVDLDHPKTSALKRFLLPATAARSGRPARPMSHYWYQVEGALPATRQYKMPDGAVVAELRSSRSQTAIPGSIHPTGEPYLWEGEPWGGEAGPTRVSGQRLAASVGLLALGTLLVENWPSTGSRHEAYLALAGALLRGGRRGGVSRFWEQHLPYLIIAMADATHDSDGGDTRVKESVPTTIQKLREEDSRVTGWPSLAEIVGQACVKRARLWARQVEELSGVSTTIEDPDLDLDEPVTVLDEEEQEEAPQTAESSWRPVVWDPYLAGEYKRATASVLSVAGGGGLFYTGQVNMLYGASETAKSWIALYACLQEMAKPGEHRRVLYIDFEAEAGQMMERLFTLGSDASQIRDQFAYVAPDQEIGPLQWGRWGEKRKDPEGKARDDEFTRMLEQVDPSLLVVDSMTMLYGIHGLDMNDAIATSHVSSWLNGLSRKGRTTVLVIDHTPKGAKRGALPSGSGYKMGMIRGAMIQAWLKSQPHPGALGEVELYIGKDRIGAVRDGATIASPQMAALAVLDSREPGVTRFSLLPPPDPKASNSVVVDRSGVPPTADDLRRSAEAKARQDLEARVGHVLAVYEGEEGRVLSQAEIGRALVERLLVQKVPAWLPAVLTKMVLGNDAPPDLDADGNPKIYTPRTDTWLVGVGEVSTGGRPSMLYRLVIGDPD